VLAITNRALATFGGSVYLAFGILALMTTSLISGATTLTTSQFLQLWAETILALIFGFLLIVAGVLVGSSGYTRRLVGGAVGVLAALVGAINIPVLLNFTIGLTSGGTFLYGGNTTQISDALVMMIIGALVALLVGLPLGMVGSFQDISEGRPDSQEQA
jgi:hypothetical protein